jgi:hypothetical protein
MGAIVVYLAIAFKSERVKLVLEQTDKNLSTES